jgi:hypothetical protein
MNGTQTLMIDTIAGPKPMKAPGGWEFDDTAKTVWCWLVNYTFDLHDPRHKQRLKRDEFVLKGQVHALAIILANALGMAPFYWENAAKELMNG